MVEATTARTLLHDAPPQPLELALAARTARRRIVEAAGATTAVFEYPASVPDAPTFVLVHGFRGTHHGLLPVVAAMPEARFLAPDLPGFGESSPLPGGHSLDGYATWLRELLAAEDAGAAAIVLGHSFGSLIVARAAAAAGAAGELPAAAGAPPGRRPAMPRVRAGSAAARSCS